MVLQLEETVRSMVMRYGSRIWKLRVLQAEIKMTIRIMNSGNRIPVRLFLSNESGYYLDITMYKEVTDEKTGQVCMSTNTIEVTLVRHRLIVITLTTNRRFR